MSVTKRYDRMFGGAITSTSQPHAVHMVKIDTNYPTSSIIAQYTSGACEVYITGTGSSNYIAHVYGDGDMADYSSASEVPWYQYLHTGSTYSQSKITSVVIHDGVTSVGANSFQTYNTANYSTIQSIDIAETVRVIASNAFSGNRGNVTITGGTGIRRIYNSAFPAWGGSTYYTLNWDIPISVSKIDSSAFFTLAFFANNTSDYMIVGDGCLIKYGIDSTSLIVPQNVKCVSLYYTTEAGAETTKQKLTSIDFSQSQVEYLGISALNGHNLTALDLPNMLKHIGSNAFANNTDLRKVWLPSSVTSINGGEHRSMTSSNTPFNGCTNSQLKIFCEATSKPEGWFAQWNYSDATHPVTVVWGASHSEYESY